MKRKLDHNPIICAIDTTDLEYACELTQQLEGHVGAIKLGLEFFIVHGLKGVCKIAQKKVPIFLDLKFHDIPNTIAAVVREVCKLPGVFMLTVHVGGAEDMLKAAVDAADSRVKIIGVTVLTHIACTDDAVRRMKKVMSNVIETTKDLEQHIAYLAEQHIAYLTVTDYARDMEEAILLDIMDIVKKFIVLERQIDTEQEHIGYNISLSSSLRSLSSTIRSIKRQILQMASGSLPTTEVLPLSFYVARRKAIRGDKIKYETEIKETIKKMGDYIDIALHALNKVRASIDMCRGVAELTEIAYDAGLGGVVCSAHEVNVAAEIAKKTKSARENFVFVVPGIRPEGYLWHDHKRVATPEYAIEMGADYIVLGRPITQHDNPVKFVKEIKCSIGL